MVLLMSCIQQQIEINVEMLLELATVISLLHIFLCLIAVPNLA